MNPGELTPDELQAILDDYQFNRTMDAIDLTLQQQIAQGNAAAIRQDLAEGTSYRTQQILSFEQQLQQAGQAGFNRVWRLK